MPMATRAGTGCPTAVRACDRSTSRTSPTRCKRKACRSRRSCRLGFAEVAGMVEAAGLQVPARDRNFRQRGLRQNLGGDVVDCGIGDFVDEAHIFGFAGSHARDDPPPSYFGIEACPPAPPPIVHTT